MSKFDGFRRAVERGHDDLYSDSEYTATFYNYSGGSYDPNTGKITGASRDQIASIQVEYVPPTIDSTVDTGGTSFSWDTSIRFPQDDVSQDDLVPLGTDNDRPTEVELSDPNESSSTTYELHGYSIEQGSGMFMCRLIEQ